MNETMVGASYWNERVKAYGDTGWKNRQVFDYDQPLRLRTIESLLKTIDIRGEEALDFGCGIGDFIPILFSQYKHVTGTDISDKALEIAKMRFRTHKQDVSFVPLSAVGDPESVDFILSITVMMCLSDELLRHQLSKFYSVLRPGGFFLSLETYESNKKGKSKKNDYLCMRSLDEFSEAAASAGFHVKQTWNYYHPLQAPTFDFFVYALLCLSSNVLKLIYPRSLQPKLGFNPAKWFPRRDTGIVSYNSPTKIVLLQKA